MAGADIHFDSNGAGALERLSPQGTAVDQGGYRSRWVRLSWVLEPARIPTAKLGGFDSRMDL